MEGFKLGSALFSVDKDGIIGSQVQNLEDLEKVEKTQAMLEKKGGISDS